MISVYRAGDRLDEVQSDQGAWLAAPLSNEAEPEVEGFGALRAFKEGRLPPRGSAIHPYEDMEVITYVREGTLLFEDSTGSSGVLQAGEFQLVTAAREIRYSASNASSRDPAHVFQVWLRTSETDLEPSYTRARFSMAQRHDVLCIVASPDGRDGSLKVHQQAFLYSSMLQKGRRIVHELVPGRCAWLHVIAGGVTLGDEALESGDGAGYRAEHAVSLTATEDSEILLLDLLDSDNPPGRSPVVEAP